MSKVLDCCASKSLLDLCVRGQWEGAEGVAVINGTRISHGKLLCLPVCVCVCKPFDPFRLDPNQLCTQYVVVVAAVVVRIVRDANQCARKCDCRNSATNSIFAPHYDYNYRVPS